MLTVLIVPLIVVMSCFIAYFGDYLGRRLGKRRLVLLGLRPRHSAILITVFTGMIIACVTLGAMMAVNKDVARALLHFAQVSQDLRQARIASVEAQHRAIAALQAAELDERALKVSQARRAELHVLEGQAVLQEQAAERKLTLAQSSLQTGLLLLQEVRARKRGLQKEVAGLKMANGTLVNDRRQQLTLLSAATASVTGLRSQQAALHSQLSELSGRERDYQSKVDDLRTEVAGAEDARRDAENRRKLAIEQLASATTALQDQETHLLEARARLKPLTDEAHELQARIVALQGSNDELQSHNAVLTSTNTALTDRNNSLQQKNDELVSTNDRLAKENQDAAVKLEATKREILQAADTINHMWTAWRESTHNSIMFEPDQLVAQGVVNCDRPAAEVVHTVEGIVTDAQIAARSAGAGDNDGDGRPLRLMDPTNSTPKHDAVLRTFIHSLADRHGDVVVRVQALRRFFVGDEVVASIYAVPNRRIYTRGQAIATARLNGSETERDIRNAVAEFLTTRVRPNAIEAGILPDTNNQISADVLDKILDLTRQVRDRGRPVEVVAMAAEDTWCSQPLDLTFRVR